MAAPDPTELHPTTRPDLTNVVFLAYQITSNLIDVGDFTYYDDEGRGDLFETTNVKYLYGPQRLVIGRFCAIGPGTEFLMPAGNHPMVGPSTFPFTMFGGDWTDNTLDTFMSIEQPGDTVVGNDVWIGRNATVLPGVTIGTGAVIGANSVVSRDVEPYAIVAGNPAKKIRRRFDDDQIASLLASRWWDWPIDAITEHATTLMAGTPDQLARIAEQHHPHRPNVDERST
ncbi:CatB-related O-acetyltransferase [Ilumatobacter sp.]|uniref:CatB-related O-acetyltransferase n=1 Tax=Ilumatobacter sp. TaxID=1967498 RepID=UPI003C6F6AFD